MPAAVESESDGCRRVGEVEVEAGGFGVEPVGESAQQPAGAGAEDAEPVLLGVGGAGIVAETVDEGVVPGFDSESVGRKDGWWGHGGLLLRQMERGGGCGRREVQSEYLSICQSLSRRISSAAPDRMREAP